MSNTYDLLGNITSITDPKGQTTQFVYDGAGRLAEVITPVIVVDPQWGYQYNASRVKDRRGGEFTPFPVPAHQTGRAELPHPAFRLTSP
jgi:YD repeat-containing protein